ncbi:MAG: hypothetical protein AcusKO_18310 [Acuticoccus sp.]
MVNVGLTGEMIILAPRERLYRAMGDRTIVQRALPRCRSFVSTDRGYRCELESARLGETLVVDIIVSNMDAPAGFSFRAEAAAPSTSGHIRISAHVALAAIDPGTTNIAYHITASATEGLAEFFGADPKTRCEAYADDVLANLARLVESQESVAFALSEPVLPERPAAPVAASAMAAADAGAGLAPAPPAAAHGARPQAAPNTVEPPAPGPGARSTAWPPYASPVLPAEPRPNKVLRLFFVGVGIVIIAILLQDAF